jgi:RNA polymerase sigma factor (sigma-70 family)
MTKRARAKRDALAEANMPLVVSIAERFLKTLPDSFCLCDLVGEGNLALLKAAAAYDPANHKGTPFSAYARKKIRGAILDSVGRRVASNGVRRGDRVGGGHNTNKYLANTCRSIDNNYLDGKLPPAARIKGQRSDIDAALARMAHQPTAPIAIDRAKRNQRGSDAISYLSLKERTLLRLWYHDSEPHPRAVARLMGITLVEAQRVHDSAIANANARLNGGALPKAA